MSMINEGSSYHVYYEHSMNHSTQIYKQVSCIREIQGWVKEMEGHGFTLTCSCSRGGLGWFLVMTAQNKSGRENGVHGYKFFAKKDNVNESDISNTTTSTFNPDETVGVKKIVEFWWSIHHTWDECSSIAVHKETNENFMRKCISYNEERQQFFLIMHKKNNHKQCICQWNVFKSSQDLCWARTWLRIKYSEGLHPFFVFKIPGINNTSDVSREKLLIGVSNHVEHLNNFDLAMDFTKY